MEQLDQKIKILEETAKKYYQDDGQNQWPHIQRVKEQAELLATYRGKPLTLAEVAAIYFHDIGKAEAGNTDHGIWAAHIAKPLLAKQLTPEQLDEALTAIRAHNQDKPSPTPAADLLRSADANRPDLPWFLRKSYYKMRKQGLTKSEAVKNALRMAKKHIVTAAQLKHRPDLYTQAFAEEIKQAEQEADALKEEDVSKLINAYKKEHPTESVYT